MRQPIRHVVTAVGLCLVVNLSCTLERPDPAPLVSVAVFGEDLPSGTIVDPTMLLFVDYPLELVTGLEVRSADTHYVFGQKLMIPGQRGDPLMWRHFEATWERRLLNQILLGQVVIFELRDVAQIGALCPRQRVNVIQKRRDILTNGVSTKIVLEYLLLLNLELSRCEEFTRHESVIIAVPVELVPELELAVAEAQEGLPLALSGYEPPRATRATRISCGWATEAGTHKWREPRPPDEVRRLTLDVIRRTAEAQDL